MTYEVTMVVELDKLTLAQLAALEAAVAPVLPDGSVLEFNFHLKADVPAKS